MQARKQAMLKHIAEQQAEPHGIWSPGHLGEPLTHSVTFNFAINYIGLASLVIRQLGKYTIYQLNLYVTRQEHVTLQHVINNK